MTVAANEVSRAGTSAVAVTRAVVVSQSVFTAGHYLTTGAFLLYFANALRPSAAMLAVLLIAPEACSAGSLLTRRLVARIGSRKRVWALFFLLARLFACGVPAMAVPGWRPDDGTAFWIIVAAVGLSSLFQSIAYVAYLSWLSDLVDSTVWGAFFALRRIAQVAVLMFLPAVALLLRRDWSGWLTDAATARIYLTVFLTGNGLLLLSMVPLLRIPDVPHGALRRETTFWRAVRQGLLSSPPLRWMIVSAWWLAFAQGLTQTAFVRYQIDVLRLPLETYLLLSGLMYGLQMPCSAWGGRLSDRVGDRTPLIIALVLVSGAMGFWLLARPGAVGWLWGAYATWGLFGFINVCQRNLLLRQVHQGNNLVPLACLEQVAGLIAALAGLLGGWLLGQLTDLWGTDHPRWPFLLLFVLSWLGRATAAVWLLPVRDAPARGPGVATD